MTKPRATPWVEGSALAQPRRGCINGGADTEHPGVALDLRASLAFVLAIVYPGCPTRLRSAEGDETAPVVRYDARSRFLCSTAKRREDSSKCFILRDIEARHDVTSWDAMGGYERPLAQVAGSRVHGQRATTLRYAGATDAMGG